MKLLLHICCAPCSVACVRALRGEGLDVSGFWYNPNIHPFTEYKARRDALAGYADSVNLPLTARDEYGLRDFLTLTWPASPEPGRCVACYQTRMDAAAAHAAENGFEAFSTTLLISPYQRHDLLCETAEETARRHGVRFLYRDFRPLFREGQAEARELGLYRQKYCGCIFSEEERYA